MTPQERAEKITRQICATMGTINNRAIVKELIVLQLEEAQREAVAECGRHRQKAYAEGSAAARDEIERIEKEHDHDHKLNAELLVKLSKLERVAKAAEELENRLRIWFTPEGGWKPNWVRLDDSRLELKESVASLRETEEK